MWNSLFISDMIWCYFKLWKSALMASWCGFGFTECVAVVCHGGGVSDASSAHAPTCSYWALMRTYLHLSSLRAGCNFEKRAPEELNAPFPALIISLWYLVFLRSTWMRPGFVERHYVLLTGVCARRLKEEHVQWERSNSFRQVSATHHRKLYKKQQCIFGASL